MGNLICINKFNLFCYQSNSNNNNYKDKYFNLINTYQNKYFSYIINNLDFNYRVCTQKKLFNKVIAIQKLKMYTNIKINNDQWKIYLMDYINNRIYSGDSNYEYIKNKINDNSFYYQNYFQSIAFYQSIQNIIKPEIIIKTEKNIKEMNCRESSEIFQILSQKGNSINNSKLSNLNRLITIRNRSFEIVKSKTIRDIIYDDTEEEDYFCYKSTNNELNKIGNIFKNSIKNKNHPLNIIIGYFEEIFSNEISSIVLNTSYNNNSVFDALNFKNNEIIENRINSLIKQIQMFAIKMQTCMKLFYIDSVSFKSFLEERDEITNIIIGQLFITHNFHNKIRKLFEFKIYDNLSHFKSKLEMFSNLLPEDIGIQSKFSLNSDTINEQYNILNKYINDNKEKIQINHLNEKFNTIKKSIKQNSLSLNNSNNFIIAIQKLMSVEDIKTPYKKMVTISALAEEVIKCINKFWEDLKPYIPDYDYLTISADDIMSLFIYILIQSKMNKILIDEQIIENFTTQTSKTSSAGYYFITLQAAIDYILNENVINDKNKRSIILEKISISKSIIDA